MPTISVVVEGGTDVAFFNNLAQILSLTDDTFLVPQIAYGKGNIKDVVNALLSGHATRLIIAEDINHRTPDQIIQSHRDSVSAHLGHPATILPDSAESFMVRDITVAVIPMGLPGDPDLNDLGITSHAMEDYLIKLLLLDESLRQDVPQFRELITELIQTIRSYGVTFDSSKELFQLVKPLIKLGFSDTVVVESLFRKADADILRSVMEPLLDRLERAAAT